MEGMSKSILVVGAMASAMLLASMAAMLTAVPGASKTQTVTLVGAGDIAECSPDNNAKATAALLDNIPGTVFTLGDSAYPDGTRAQFRECYDPTWGKYKKRTRPAVGDQEYATSGAKPYFD
jgi:alkaline phosphatase